MSRFKTVVNLIGRFASDNSPHLLTGVAIAGTISTAVLAGKASVRAADLIRDFERHDGPASDPKERAKERVGLVWKEFIPPAGMAAVTVVSIVGLNRIGTRRAAAMAAAYTTLDKSFSEYRENVVEKLGKGKEQSMRDEMAQKRVERNPQQSSEVVILGNGEVLCFDQYSSRYFSSSMETIKKAQNDINYRVINHDWASLNEFYDELGLKHTKFGDDIGWTPMEKLEVKFSSVLNELGQPVLALDFYVDPKSSR